ncbi:lactosylceramide 4-alpha-galactosyltransferase-like [Onthophagus taurus]|uniref:lactosylceramide 4-alpha-galactosyltransferase-like n=1 Tax=Onthophagus taurus TaxID=166361 RepID=UPI0039BE71CE
MKFNVGNETKTLLNEIISNIIDDFENNHMHISNTNELSEIITDCLKSFCGINNMSEIIAKNCSGIKIYPSIYFMPYRQDKWKRYFDKNGVKVLNKIKRSYGVHLWENKSGDFRSDLNSNSAFAGLARKHCPQIVKYSKGYI